jgi:hypothetical protein
VGNLRRGNGTPQQESSLGTLLPLYLKAAGEELQACSQLPVAVQPFQSLQALQTDFPVLLKWDKQEKGNIADHIPINPTSTL